MNSPNTLIQRTPSALPAQRELQLNVYVRNFKKTLSPVNLTQVAVDSELKIYNVVGGWKMSSKSQERTPAWAVTKITGERLDDMIYQLQGVRFVHCGSAALAELY